MPEVTYLEAIRQALFQALEGDDRVILLGEDVGRAGGVFRVSDGLQERFGPQRVIDTPMAELSVVGIAVGAAMAGWRPIAEIEFADFVHAAHEQILNEAAKIRYRSLSGWTVPLVIRMPWGAGIHGGLYHSQSLEALFSHYPGLKVVAPSTPYDAKGLLLAALADPDPVIFLEHKRSYRAVRGEVPQEAYTVPLGEARLAREGRDVTVFAYGYMLQEALRAAEEAAGEGISVEVLDPRTLLPLDRQALFRSVEKTGRLVVVYEDTKFLGYGAEVGALVAEHCFADLRAPVRRVAGPDVPGVPFADALEEEYLPDAADVLEAIREVAAYRRARPAAGEELALPELAAPIHDGWEPGRPLLSSRGELLRLSPDGGALRRLPAGARELARRQAAWKREAPHVSSVLQVDVSRALERAGEEGLPALVLKWVGQALEAHPGVNVRWEAEGVRRLPQAEVAVYHGGRWRVLGDPGSLEAGEITRLLGGEGPGLERPSTFSLRFQRSLFSTPLILEPHAAALAVSPLRREAVAVEEGYAVRPVVWLSVSIDHRCLDGADADRFLSWIRDRLEERAGEPSSG